VLECVTNFVTGGGTPGVHRRRKSTIDIIAAYVQV